MKVTRNCETCGEQFTANEVPSKTPPRYCSQQCWLKKHNNPERNRELGRRSREKIGAAQRNRGACIKTYRKYLGHHEHRVIMERIVGRKLRSDEIVHHKDGNLRNNDPANLELTNRRDHAKLHNTGKKRCRK